MKEPTMISKIGCGTCGKIMAGVGVVTVVLFLMVSHVYAMQFDTGNPDVGLRWDNTVTYSVMDRLGNQDKNYIGETNNRFDALSNNDDGDRNFDPGLVMNRFDILSEVQASFKDFGVYVKGAGWYDFVYNTSNDNNSPLTVNKTGANDEFNRKTKDLHGRYAELLDAFTYGSMYLGDMKLNYKAGNLAQWWGVSFFFGDNGVASGLTPMDVGKASGLPNTQGKELVRPVPQVSADLLITNDLSVGAYYQFTWAPNRMMATGSYWEFVDLIGPGSELLLAGPDTFFKDTDADARDDGQFGVKMLYTAPFGVDFGAYMLNYHFKGPNYLVVNPIDGKFYHIYPEDIKVYALSANTSVSVFTIGAEVTYKRNMPLVSQNITVFPNFGPFVDMPHDPMYAVGQSLHYNLNFFCPGLPSNFFSDSADFIFEIGGNSRLKVDEHPELLDPTVDRTAWEMKMVYTPKWYQVLPGLDLTMPMGATYVPNGKTSVPSSLFPFDEGGDYNIGVGGTYLNVWEFELSYRNFFGSASATNNWADRELVSFYLRRAF